MFLRQSTAQTIRFGPFLDATDGVTEETGLTLTQAEMRLSKDGGAFAQKNATGNATHDSDGWYSTSLDATDTNTVGELILNVQQPANALPVWMRFYVVEEAIYDDLFAASSDPFTVMQSDVAAIHSQTTVIESDTAVIESDTTAIHSDTTIIASDVVILVSDTTAIHSDTTIIHSDTIVISSDTAVIESDTTAIHSDTTIIASDVVIVVSDTTAIHSDTTIIHSDTIVISSDTVVIESDTTRLEQSLVVATGALEATPTSTVLQTDLAEVTNNHYKNMVFMMTSGDEAGEARRIDDYAGATGTITLKTALSGAPTAAETFVILAIPVYGDAIYSDTTVVESDTTAIHSQTTVIESDSAVIESDTTAIHSDTTIIASDVVIVVSDTTAIHSDTTIIASDVVQVYSDTTILVSDTTAIHSDTTIIASDVVILVSDTTAIHSDTTIIHSDTIVISSDTAKIESDVALFEAAHAEPAGVPAANESPLDKIGYLFMALRNKVTVTSTKKQFYDDADAVEWEKDLTDDGTTYTETEGNAP